MKTFEGYMKGINLGGWLSQCDHTKERYDTFVTEKDIETIKNWGMDHVRVPIDYELIQDKAGNYLKDGFGYIDKAIEWCGKYGLNMVLDVHKTYGYSFDLGYNEHGFFDDESLQERFLKMWEVLAEKYGKFSNRVAFELLNEVTAKEYSVCWNKVSTECIKRIRKIAPDVMILLGGYYNNSIDALPDLPLPLDEKVVYNFHCYDPFIFTHQGAPWADKMSHDFRMPFEATYKEYDRKLVESRIGFSSILRPVGVTDDTILGEEYFENLMMKAVKIAEERNVALYCGEFGVIDNATPEDTLKWYTKICACLNRHGIAHAAWSYRRMDFGLSDERLDGVREGILKVF